MTEATCGGKVFMVVVTEKCVIMTGNVRYHSRKVVAVT